MKTARQLWAGLLALAFGFLCRLPVHAETNAPAISVHELLPNAVRVEILEGLPDQPGWNFTNPPVNETYAEPAFGFVVLPTKYSAKGIKADRKAPFMLRAAAKVTLPAGEQRILFRARTGARLFLDGKQLLTIRFPSLISDGHEEVPE